MGKSIGSRALRLSCPRVEAIEKRKEDKEVQENTKIFSFLLERRHLLMMRRQCLEVPF
jgi:hypothetical protein